MSDRIENGRWFDIQEQPIELEASILSAIMLDADDEDGVWQTAEAMITKESFSDPRHRVIYEGLKHLRDQRLVGDLVSLFTYLGQIGKVHEAGGVVYIAEVLQIESTTATFQYHTSQLRDVQTRQTMGKILDNAMHRTGDANESIGAVCSYLEKHIRDLQPVTSQFISIADIMSDVVDQVQLAQEGMETGILTGFRGYDDLVGGLQKGELVILAACPSIGKTALMLDWARYISRSHSVGILSMEMNKRQLGKRMVAAEGEINSHRMSHGGMSSDEGHRLTEAISSLSKRNIRIDDFSRPDIGRVTWAVRNLVREYGAHVVMIDYLQLIKSTGQESRRLEIDEITATLKGLANDLDIPIVCLCQLSRATESRGDGKPQLSDLKESGGIEQDADTVLFLYKPYAYGIGQDRDRVELIVSKNRNGRVGEIPLRFFGSYSHFEDETGASA